MSNKDFKLMAHLLRRAGFGATPDELDGYVAAGYEATVENLLNPGDPGNLADDLIKRYHVDMSELRQLDSAASYWMYRIVTTNNPLEEKMALFWHGLFATGYSKLNQARSHLNQIDMFRRLGMGNFGNLLIELSRDPAMIFWLDNQDNHKDAINENYGRELLELFSMGIGNYSEEDVKEAARAFTGWTLGNAEYMSMRATKDSIWPYGRIAWHFDYRANDHDEGGKKFLGESGNFTGEDIVGIICKNPATPAFICTRLFQFFTADNVDDEGEKVISQMTQAYFESGFEIKAVLRKLFNSSYFKSEAARFARVKGPVELVAGAIRLACSYQTTSLGIIQAAHQSNFMGQGLLQPPTVEGWHEGEEWIDSGALVERINFVALEVGDVEKSGIRSIIDRLAGLEDGKLTPSTVVERCLEMLGHLSVSDITKKALTDHVAIGGNIDLSNHQVGDKQEQRVGELLSLITASREYQLA